jgi:hypothetical protein
LGRYNQAASYALESVQREDYVAELYIYMEEVASLQAGNFGVESVDTYLSNKAVMLQILQQEEQDVDTISCTLEAHNFKSYCPFKFPFHCLVMPLRRSARSLALFLPLHD